MEFSRQEWPDLLMQRKNKLGPVVFWLNGSALGTPITSGKKPVLYICKKSKALGQMVQKIHKFDIRVFIHLYSYIHLQKVV